MNMTFNPATDPEPTAHNTQSRPRSVTTEFSEARHQLMLECKYSPALNKPLRAVQKGIRQQEIYANSSTLFEEAFYWFISAPALVYVVYLAFGL